MNHRLATFASALGLLLAACGDRGVADKPTPDTPTATGTPAQDTLMSLTSESLVVMNALADSLETVTDEASAKARRSELEGFSRQLEALKVRTVALGKPDQAEMQAMVTNLGPSLAEAAGRLQAAKQRVETDPAVARELEGLMRSLGALGG